MRYDIKIYDKDKHFTVEHETIRNLTYTQMLIITQVLTRYGIIYNIAINGGFKNEISKGNH